MAKQRNRHPSHPADKETEAQGGPRPCRFSDRGRTWSRVLSTNKRTNNKPIPYPQTRASLSSTDDGSCSVDSRDSKLLIISSISWTKMEFSREWTCCLLHSCEPLQLGQILFNLVDPLVQNQLSGKLWIIGLCFSKPVVTKMNPSFCLFYDI